MTGERPLPDAARPAAIVVMGVSASGKSSVARALADLRGVGFVDADDLHPEENVAKMASGHPLDDADRAPWLDAVATVLVDVPGVVVACSALKRTYRDRLRARATRVLFVHLHGDDSLLAQRASARIDHFMPPELLTSQLDTLELLAPDEDGIELDVAAPVEQIALSALEWVRTHEH